MRTKLIKGFSKLSLEEKRYFISLFCKDPENSEKKMEEFLFSDPEQRKHFLELSENTISSFHLPYGIVPNVVVDGKIYHVPMAVEESSVVAAASHSARFWSEKGGFKVKQVSTEKPGHVYFRWFEDPSSLLEQWEQLRLFLLERLKKITASMVHRGGGVLSVDLLDETSKLDHLYKIELKVDTVNSMGANFVNTCLEDIAESLELFFDSGQDSLNDKLQVIMAILTNNTAGCTVTLEASCKLHEMQSIAENLPVEEFADKMEFAYRIATVDPLRATTHNKGIMNGVDAVLIATGNDFRAAEAASHAYASSKGSYRSLSSCSLESGIFSIGITLPLALGTVGGITNLHPMARLSLEILGNPTAKELMGVVAAVGLATNFAAVRSLVTTGIQKGHMRLHLSNILNSLNARPENRKEAESWFRKRKVSFNAVKHFLDEKNH
jgi:hydroxymethylglutaryl-CoA reductase